jgi:hypothetical protein
MSALLDEEYRLIVGYVLSAYHSYRYEHVQPVSALGQQMVRAWEEYDRTCQVGYANYDVHREGTA